MKRSIFLIFIATFCFAVVTSYSQTYELIWSDEFNDSISSDWDYEIGGHGWGNGELQYYTDGLNSFVENGNLVIQARHESYGGNEYTSSRMITYPSQTWQYGRIEARIKLPAFMGSWPAFWMLGNSIKEGTPWPGCGEIDILEHINTESVIVGTMHWEKWGLHVSSGNNTPCDVTNYHEYAIEWDETGIRWFLDGNQYHTANIEGGINDKEEFHEPFFIILNLAIGGQWPGYTIDDNAFPANMYVDYVRVYKKTEPYYPLNQTIEAEDYYEMSGIQTESCSDGGLNVGWIDAGDFMNYHVDVPESGTYTINYRVASLNGGGSLQLESVGGGTVYGTLDVPGTGGWQNWTTVSHIVNLNAGQQDIAIRANSGGWNINWWDGELGSGGGGSIGIVEAEDYTQMSGIQTEPCSEGGENVGWIDPNDWMIFNASAPESGTYTIYYRVASPNDGGELQLEKAGGSTVYGTVDIPNTGGWQNWTTVSHTVNLDAGAQLAIKANTGGWNINWWSDVSNKSAVIEGLISEEISEESVSDITISPNPVVDVLTINGVEDDQPVEVYNLVGVKVIEETGNQIDVSSLSNGIYVLQVNDEKIKFLKK